MKQLNKIELRPYQKDIIEALRVEYRTHNKVFLQLATGGGKTVIISQITKTMFSKNMRIWFIVPRNELLQQAQSHFYRWDIPHSTISAGRQESRAFKVHIISKDTLIRRIKSGKIKNWPDFCIFDEGHVAIDQQKLIMNNAPEGTKFLAVSGTPERTDGRGLSDLYQSIVYGPDYKELIETGYLSEFRYFCPPIEGLEKLHIKGSDYDAKELEAFFKRRAIYGKAISHYKQYANKEPCIVFCRNIKLAEETAHNFRQAGFNFESIDGTMAKGRRKEILQALESGIIDGITSVDLVIYGLDIPRINCIIMLRPTISRAVFFQMIGRALRPVKGKTAIVLDHVGNFHEHVDRDRIDATGNIYDGFCVEWNFFGKEKRKRRKKKIDDLIFCKTCYMYFTGKYCPTCGPVAGKRRPKSMKEIEGELQEQVGPVPISDRPYEEKKEFHDRISTAKQTYYDSVTNGKIDYSAIQEMVDIQESCGYAIMWIYHQLNNLEKMANVPLLYAIAKVKNYKKGWVYMKRKEIQEKIANKKNELFHEPDKNIVENINDKKWIEDYKQAVIDL